MRKINGHVLDDIFKSYEKEHGYVQFIKKSYYE
jgi:hypothetical protein